MRVGVVSDTHNHIKNVQEIVELFNASDVSRVIHTGDITQAKTLDLFAMLNADFFGVYGNNDLERDSLEDAVNRHGFYFVDPPLILNWHNRKIAVLHDPLDVIKLPQADHDLVIHGHTHLYRAEQTNGQLIFNPGECAGHMPGLNTVGIVDLVSMDVELLKF